MSDAEDVHEYVDGTMGSFHVRRLLEWLANIAGSQRKADVRLSPNKLHARSHVLA